jgi:antitoxin HigA-1
VVPLTGSGTPGRPEHAGLRLVHEWRHQHVNEENGMAKIAPIHPGEILLAEFIEPRGTTQHAVASAIGVPSRQINEIVDGKRRITANTALRLGRYFNTDAMFWLNLQARHDLEAERDDLSARPAEGQEPSSA